ncbi:MULTISPECIES: septal ring lytic transglycosylase RlpA family protein [unclassified Achromobacter]|uniref:septal ring lytic transglycosylase RlpA family protein n=1 Tax=unclassified Achromobacter TaxID=2626865 RepID=UPI001E5A2985|nr:MULTISPECIES: septal ring lytic transglycosylase RlpA family protein [unclassified Achromobacter]
MIVVAMMVAGCSSTGHKRGGGYYSNDGPGDDIPANIEAIPDAVPRVEPYAGGANRPYVVFGKRYVPDTSDSPFKQRGIASWYGKKFHGNSTSIGESYDMYAMTAAHPTLPIPSYARVTSAINGKSIIVRVNDRGPFHDNRIMDLSYVAAYKLGIIGPGSGEVTVERILPAEARQMAAAAAAGGAVAAGTPAVTPALAPANTAEGDAPVIAPSASIPVPLAPAAAAAPGGSRTAALPPTTSAAAAATIPPPALARSGAATAGNVYLQLGAFSQAGNAQSLVSRINGPLAAAGLPQAQVAQTGNLYRVHVGPYSDRNSAEAALQSVADRTGILPSIITR